jgi:hypothetical protein
MSEGRERRFYKGAAGWVIIAAVAILVIILAVFVVYGSTILGGRPGTGTGPTSETAEQSATSGPGHNTSEATQPVQTGNEGIAGSTPGAKQIPGSDITYGRETSGIDTNTARLQNLSRNGNITNSSGNLANPLSENITSMTGTAGE